MVSIAAIWSNQEPREDTNENTRPQHPNLRTAGRQRLLAVLLSLGIGFAVGAGEAEAADDASAVPVVHITKLEHAGVPVVPSRAVSR